jgi:hypothetical protein
VDLKTRIAARFGVTLHERTAGKQLGASNWRLEYPKLCVSDVATAVFRYGQASKRPENIIAS